MQVTVPPNTHATVRIPADDLSQVTESGQPLSQVTGVNSAQVRENVVAIEIGAGQYDFVSVGLNLAKAMATVRHVAGRLDIYCSLRDLLADERSGAVLLKNGGEQVFDSPRMRRVMDQPVEALARFAPQALPPERLQSLQQELLAL
jgi:hypothetical protein